MRKLNIIALVMFLFLQGAGSLYGAIPAKERAALIALYNATDGDNQWYYFGWKQKPLEPDGFGPIGSEGTWEGITVTNDHVTEIWVGNIERQQQKESSVTFYNIPPDLGDLSHLESLTLEFMYLAGAVPAELGKLSKLKYLILPYNNLTAIAPELGNLVNLQHLNLIYNDIAAIPPELGNLTRLVYLNMGNNKLTSIPPELGNLKNLQDLYLEYNQLTGEIPPELGNLGSLEELFLDNNRLTGIIPAELGKLSNLVFMYFSSNLLSGSIPPEIGNLGVLQDLYLDNNQLSGNIPAELGNLSYLRKLWLNGNKLTGDIPSSITNLYRLLTYHTNFGYNGLYTNDENVRLFLNSKDEDWQATQTIAPSDMHASTISTVSIEVSWTPVFYDWDTGGYRLYYSTASGGPWIYAGMTSDKTDSSYDVTGLVPGETYYFTVRTQTDPHAENANTVVSDSSEEVSAVTTAIPPGQDQPPFGYMDLPVGGSTPVSGSIAVSGWALDDVEVTSVKIYRVMGNSKTYIGDAVFVEGARTDIAQAFPSYPNYNRAGWGYMLLTNFLPNGGNGTFTLRAVAADSRGHQTILGNKTIICDNAHAVKPFGAIDTPTQGGTASGGDFRNQGWVLTPMPNKIPENGSTIDVYLDGVYLGNCQYNLYREDIATLFPGYANSDGAWAYFDFDTTGYADGVHTIYWIAEDDAGNADGIGSRYFSIQNAAGRGNTLGLPISDSHIPVDYLSPVRVKKGCSRDTKFQDIYPDENGVRTVEISVLERVEIWVGAQHAESLPVGSTLDGRKGVFYWIPGPGFYGTYPLVFIEKSGDDVILKYIHVIVR